MFEQLYILFERASIQIARVRKFTFGGILKLTPPPYPKIGVVEGILEIFKQEPLSSGTSFY
jgi:hypothetical protein